MPRFFDLLDKRWEQGCLICVGLDLEPDHIPASIFSPAHINDVPPDSAVGAFLEANIDATWREALCYKFNDRTYMGKEGTLDEAVAHVRKRAPGIPILVDGKYGDVRSTNQRVEEYLFGVLGAGAITVNPYVGYAGGLDTFFEYGKEAVLVWCRSTNGGAEDFQDRIVEMGGDYGLESATLWELAAYRTSREWNTNGNCGIIIGSTEPEHVGAARRIVGDMWILCPGIGRQDGDFEETIRQGLNSQKRGLILSSSHNITYASSGLDFAEAAQAELARLTAEFHRIEATL